MALVELVVADDKRRGWLEAALVGG